jgi:mannose-6-phosphate isomerase-like protein (cupin superfamily)
MSELLRREGRVAEIKHADDALVLFEATLDAHTDGVGLHHHERHVDSFYVLDGELEFVIDGNTVQARAGEFVVAHPGVVHAFRNASEAQVRYLNLHTPGMRFDEYVRRMDAGDELDPAEYDVFND